MHVRKSCPELVEHFGLLDILDDLDHRIKYPGNRAVDRLTGGILKGTGARSPMQLDADEFNLAAEKYYRTSLRLQHVDEAFTILREAIEHVDELQSDNSFYRNVLQTTIGDANLVSFWLEARERFSHDRFDALTLDKLMKILLLIVHLHRQAKKQAT